MATSNSIIEEIKKLSLPQQQHIYSFLEEVIVLGKLYQEMGNIMGNSVTFVNHAERPLLISLNLLHIKAKNHWTCGSNMRNV